MGRERVWKGNEMKRVRKGSDFLKKRNYIIMAVMLMLTGCGSESFTEKIEPSMESTPQTSLITPSASTQPLEEISAFDIQTLLDLVQEKANTIESIHADLCNDRTFTIFGEDYHGYLMVMLDMFYNPYKIKRFTYRDELETETYIFYDDKVPMIQEEHKESGEVILLPFSEENIDLSTLSTYHLVERVASEIENPKITNINDDGSGVLKYEVWGSVSGQLLFELTNSGNFLSTVYDYLSPSEVEAMVWNEQLNDYKTKIFLLIGEDGYVYEMVLDSKDFLTTILKHVIMVDEADRGLSEELIAKNVLADRNLMMFLYSQFNAVVDFETPVI